MPQIVCHFGKTISECKYFQGCELIGRPEKVSIGDQLETTFEVKWRPFGYHFEDNWRPIIKLSVVSSILGCNNFVLRKIELIFLYLDFFLQFSIFMKYEKNKMIIIKHSRIFNQSMLKGYILILFL